MATFTLSTQAYCKILLHALKYPHSAVNGVMLGEKSKIAGDSSNSIQIVDVVPLFHRWLSLSTPLEIALSQIDLFCQTQTKNLKIVGYYQANERLKDNSPDQTALKVMEKLTSLSCENILIMSCIIELSYTQVDNSKISLEADSNCLHAFCLQDQKLRPKETG
uniref:MPN domain-containing protein n=1 Tax=Romanomermis culicivorax TaxID=13658 RepID=A0A915KAG9_ROMCU